MRAWGYLRLLNTHRNCILTTTSDPVSYTHLVGITVGDCANLYLPADESPFHREKRIAGSKRTAFLVK